MLINVLKKTFACKCSRFLCERSGVETDQNSCVIRTKYIWQVAPATETNSSWELARQTVTQDMVSAKIYPKICINELSELSYILHD